MLNRKFQIQNATPQFYYPNSFDTFLRTFNPNENYDHYFETVMAGNTCRLFMKNSIIVTVQPQSTPVHVVHMYKKVSFTSQVATVGITLFLFFDYLTILCFIGGLLGLFTGMSLMSFVEIIYWTFSQILLKFGCSPKFAEVA